MHSAPAPALRSPNPHQCPVFSALHCSARLLPTTIVCPAACFFNNTLKGYHGSSITLIIKAPTQEHQHCSFAGAEGKREARRNDMGAVTTTLLSNAVAVRVRLLALLLCFQLLHTSSQAFKLRGGVVGSGGYEEKKVPLAVIEPDPSPELSGLSPSPLAAPPPVHGGGGDDMRPKLPTERWRRGRGEVRRAAHPPAATAKHEAPAPAATAPSLAGPGPARAPAAGAPAPDSGSGTAFISSSPAVPVPRGVTDTATILPMPVPGEKRQEVGAAGSVEAACVMPLLLGIMVMMASFGI